MREVSIADAFTDDRVAHRYLEAILGNAALSPESLLPPHKWVQAIYLSDGGKLKVRPEHLVRLLDVSYRTAEDVVRHLEEMTGSASMEGIANGIAANGGITPVIAALIGVLHLVSQSLEFIGIGADAALLGLA